MDIERESSKPSIFSILITIVIVGLSLFVLYGIYGLLYGNNPLSSSVKIIQLQVPANIAQTNLPAIQNLYEGGDYTVSFWIYVNSYNINRNRRKHVLEIGGANFSTLLIALGAFKNSLLVRTHSRDSDTVVVGNTPKTNTSTPSNTVTTSSTNPFTTTSNINPSTSLTTTTSSTTTSNTNPSTTTTSGTGFNEDEYAMAREQYLQQQLAENRRAQELEFARDRGQYLQQQYSADQRREYNTATPNTRWGEPFQNATPGSSDATRQDGSLTTGDLDSLFAPLAMDDSLLNSNQICDIPNVDMQRWISITVVLSGRTIDVYMDGKLVRSCVTRSYYKVDATGIKLKLTERGGFDGYLNSVSTYNKALTPAEIYTTYELGPTGKSADFGKTISSLFTGK